MLFSEKLIELFCYENQSVTMLWSRILENDFYRKCNDSIWSI